ncbi:MAG: aminopeptidase [Phycisphaerae bacterium]
MPDERFAKLADVLVSHSTKVTQGDKVLIEAFDVPEGFVTTLIERVAAAGGRPLVSTYQWRVLRKMIQLTDDTTLQILGEADALRMKQMDCYIGVRGSHNISEQSDIPPEQMKLWEKHVIDRVHMKHRVPDTRWVVLRWPTPSMAQLAGKSTEAFEDFYFRVTAGVDYAAMKTAMRPLIDLMKKTDRVRITGPDTDLSFSIKDIGVVGCWGDRNIPDGECFTCPLKTSVNGHIRHNCESLYRGTVFNDIRLTFKDGRIVEATAGANTRQLNEILDADEGARYIGEWSLGFNPYVTTPMRDTLFDEKIAGSFHLTPGQAYKEADNGNKSQVHWDMVSIQRPEYGGGKIFFDDVLVRDDGLFVLPELTGLNPDRLGNPT